MKKSAPIMPTSFVVIDHGEVQFVTDDMIDARIWLRSNGAGLLCEVIHAENDESIAFNPPSSIKFGVVDYRDVKVWTDSLEGAEAFAEGRGTDSIVLRTA